MKAAVLKGPGNLKIENVPDPRPGNGEVLVRMKFCGICGSDLHTYRNPLVPSGCIMGHEWTGEVAELGKGVSKWSVGDRVWPGGNNKFPEYSWKPEFGWDPKARIQDDPVKEMGGYGEYAVYYRDALALIPEEVSDIEACMADQAATALGAIHASRLQIGDMALIIGAGPIGLWSLRCAQLAGARAIAVAELIQGRAHRAQKMGADLVVDPRHSDVRETLTDFFGGVGPDVVIDCAGTESSLHLAIEVLKRDGIIALVGLSNKPLTIDTWNMYVKGVELRSVLHLDFPGGMDLIQRKKVDCGDFLTEIIPLDRIQEAFEKLLHPDDEVKIIVRHSTNASS